MKTVSIRLEGEVYENLSKMLDSMGQTKQTFFETYARTALRERSIPFIIKAPLEERKGCEKDKQEAFKRLEEFRKSAPKITDFDEERKKGMDEKYGCAS